MVLDFFYTFNGELRGQAFEPQKLRKKVKLS